MTRWFGTGLSIKWFTQEGWKSFALERLEVVEGGSDEAPVFSAELDDVRIRLTVKRDPRLATAGRIGYAVETVISPLRTEALVSGIQLILPVDAALRCIWKPHLSPGNDMVVGDKMFRYPAVIFEDAERMTALVPDIAAIEEERRMPHIMDYTQDNHSLMYGLCHYKEKGHVYHELSPEKSVIEAPLKFRFYLMEWEKTEEQREKDYRAVERFLWEQFGEARMPIEDEAVMTTALTPYAEYAYGWALDRWESVTWQQFELNGEEVGGVVFIVCAKQKPGMGHEEEWREPKSLWNQAWFCGLRTAYGYALWGRRNGREDWMEKAKLALNFALSAPQINGLFPGYFQAGEDNRWESGRWYMSGPRRPAGHEDYVHLLDSSWTCYWLLKWYRDVHSDKRILPFVRRYIQRLLSLQLEDGGFPAWVQPSSSEISPYLLVSPQSSMHVMLLCLMNEIEADDRYIESAERAAKQVLQKVVSIGRWEDFETYWSCSKQWEDKQYGLLDPRSGLYNQCNFGMYWTAEAFKDLYLATENASWLDAGEQVLAEASLYQQIWQPPYFPVPTTGGFGVMNSDDEWNDARQSLFALTYQDYYRLTGNESYRARAQWAMKASFYMMYCPLNPDVKGLYDKVHPHFNEMDFGFHMENFNHHDGTPVDGLGEFTIFDWGCGAASSSLAEFDSKRKLAAN